MSESAPKGDTLIARFERAIEQGERPELVCPNLGSGLGAPDVWNAVLEAGDLDVMDVELLTNMSGLYMNSYYVVGEMERVRRLYEEYVIPRLDEGPDDFYDEAGHLKKSYRWYLPAMRNVGGGISTLKKRSDSLLVVLEPEP